MRYDQFMECLADYEDMLKTVDIRNCPCSTFRDIAGSGSYTISSDQEQDAMEVCSWPTFHTDISTLKETGKVVHVVHGQLVADPIKDTRIGRKHRDATKLLNEDDIIKAVEGRGRRLVKHISSRLEDKFYQPEDKEKIKNCRVVLGARNLVRSVCCRGAVTTSNLTQDKFLVSSEAIDNQVYERISKEELKSQYREYVRRLEEQVTEDPKLKDFSDMDLLELTVHPDNHKFYMGIEAVVSVMARASLLISVESVVESWISILEHHASQRRTLGEMLLHEELVIAVNGPSVEHCDSICQVFGTKLNNSFFHTFIN